MNTPECYTVMVACGSTLTIVVLMVVGACGERRVLDA